MADLNKGNQERLLILLERYMPPETADATLYRMVLSFVQKRNAVPDRLLFDLRASERLRAIEKVAVPDADPQEVIDRLVDLYDAMAAVPDPT